MIKKGKQKYVVRLLRCKTFVATGLGQQKKYWIYDDY